MMTLTVASFVITAIMCSIIMYIMIWHFRRRRLYKMASKFEGPPTMPIIGNAHMFMQNDEQILIELNQLTDSYSSPVRLWFGPILLFITTDPEQIKTVCTSSKTLEKGKIFRDLCSPGGRDGLVTGPVSIWKVHRKLIQPTFNAKILDSYVEVFSTQSKIFTDIIEKNLNRPEFEIFHLVAYCSLDMILETAIGVEMKTQKNKNCYYVEALQELITCFKKRMFSIWLHPDFIFHLSQLGRLQRKYINYLHGFSNNIIKEKKRQLLERMKTKRDTADDEALTPWKRKVFLDHLMTLPDGSYSLSDKEIHEEVDTMIFSGNDTTAMTDTYLLLMLASHPDIQEKVYQELNEIYGDDDIDDHPVTPKDLPRMKYLEYVIKETLRLFPPAPFIIREVTEDLNMGNHIVPRGCGIAIGTYGVQRSEKYWPNPLKFDPDRFLPEEISKRHPYAYMAFSAGPRNCLGMNYAFMSMKTFAATVLRKYILIKDNIVPVKDIRLTMELALKTVDPIKIRIERRNRN